MKLSKNKYFIVAVELLSLLCVFDWSLLCLRSIRDSLGMGVLIAAVALGFIYMLFMLFKLVLYIIMLVYFVRVIIGKEDRPYLFEIIIFLLLFICQKPWLIVQFSMYLNGILVREPNFESLYSLPSICLSIFSVAVSCIYIFFARRDQWAWAICITIISCITIPVIIFNGSFTGTFVDEYRQDLQAFSTHIFGSQLKSIVSVDVTTTGVSGDDSPSMLPSSMHDDEKHAPLYIWGLYKDGKYREILPWDIKYCTVRDTSIADISGKDNSNYWISAKKSGSTFIDITAYNGKQISSLLTVYPSDSEYYSNIALSSNSIADNLLPPDVKQPVNAEKTNIPVSRKASWQEYILSGKTFYMIFDKTSGKFDHIGTLKMGETYQLTYTNGKFICTGFNLGTNNVGTWAYSNCDPRQMKISLWGRGYTYNEKGDIIDSQYGLVGHLSSTR